MSTLVASDARRGIERGRRTKRRRVPRRDVVPSAVNVVTKQPLALGPSSHASPRVDPSAPVARPMPVAG